jgi:predicted lipid-binding transport protein (Tim44 family)
MGFNFDPLNIILIGAAIVIFWRLAAVLGQKTGLERPPLRLVPKETPELKLVATQPQDLKSTIWEGYAEAASPLALTLEALAKSQADFSVSSFLQGAAAAHELILEAFAKSDKATLKPLLTKPVFDSFSSAIDQNQKLGQTKVFQFVGHTSTALHSGVLDSKRATLTVKFESEMINATLDKSGATLQGDTKLISPDTDYWSFERDISSKDPNWKLVATGDDVA